MTEGGGPVQGGDNLALSPLRSADDFCVCVWVGAANMCWANFSNFSPTSQSGAHEQG